VFRQKPQHELGKEATAPEVGFENGYSIGAMAPRLQRIFSELSDTQKERVLEKVDAHSKYLIVLRNTSRAKMQNVIDELHGKTPHSVKNASGPGAYAARWQALLDKTLVTPSVPRGPPRLGKDVKSYKAVRKGENEPDLIKLNYNTAAVGDAGSPGLTPPDISTVVELLGPQFKKMVAEIAQDGVTNSRIGDN
jgi:hypothetical protein